MVDAGAAAAKAAQPEAKAAKVKPMFSQPAHGNFSGLIDKLRYAQEGNRNNLLLWTARAMCEEGVTEEELQRVKAQAVAARVYERDSMFFQARQIGAVEMAGLSHKVIDLFVEKLKTVTAEQVVAVAKKYLVDDTLTAAYLDPQPLSGKRPSAPPAGARHGQ